MTMTTFEARVAAHPFLKGLEPKWLATVTVGAKERVFEPGAAIIRPGEPANELHLIEQGRIAVEAHSSKGGDVCIQTIGSGDVLGWSWLFAPFSWHLQAKAVERTKTIALDGGHLLVRSESDHELGYEIMRRVTAIVIERLQATRKRLVKVMAQQGTATTLKAPEPAVKQAGTEIKDHPFLAGLKPDQIARLSQFAMPVQFSPGEVIFRTGDPANRFYLIQRGKVALESRGKNGPTQIQTLGAGDVLGWSWMFEPYKWQFEAKALEPTSAIFLYGTQLREQCEAGPDFGYELMKRCTQISIGRLQAATQRLLELDSANAA
jgi:CRP/FNR family cyclic AMP-dependent transcriptional regulator